MWIMAPTSTARPRYPPPPDSSSGSLPSLSTGRGLTLISLFVFLFKTNSTQSVLHRVPKDLPSFLLMSFPPSASSFARIPLLLPSSSSVLSPAHLCTASHWPAMVLTALVPGLGAPVLCGP